MQVPGMGEYIFGSYHSTQQTRTVNNLIRGSFSIMVDYCGQGNMCFCILSLFYFFSFYFMLTKFCMCVCVCVCVCVCMCLGEGMGTISFKYCILKFNINYRKSNIILHSQEFCL